MKSPLIIVAANRPHYFQRVVDSIESQVSDRVVYCSIDLVNCDTNTQKQQEEYIKSKIPHAKCLKQTQHLGCGNHMIFARRHMFENISAPRAFILEDDLVLAKHHLTLCDNIMDWCAQNYDNVGVVQAWNENHLTEQEKLDNAARVENTQRHWWGYLMTRKCWFSIRDLLYEYQREFIGNLISYGHRDHRKIAWWVQKKLAETQSQKFSKSFPVNKSEEGRILRAGVTGQDGVTAIALYLAGLCKVATYANRGKYIGEWGVHKNPELYRQLGLDKIDMFEPDDDKDLKEFYT